MRTANCLGRMRVSSLGMLKKSQRKVCVQSKPIRGLAAVPPMGFSGETHGEGQGFAPRRPEATEDEHFCTILLQNSVS